MTTRLLLSLPSSGSDWLASLINGLDSTCSIGHKAEAFSPIVNHNNYGLLSEVFGCELPSCMYNIARVPEEGRMRRVVKDFFDSGYNFDKEVFHFFQAGLFVEYFDKVVYLVRSTEETFPPNRLRVLAWYDAIATAFEAADWCDTKFSTESLLKRAMEVHRFCLDEIICTLSQAYDIPVIDYHVLCYGKREEVNKELSVLYFDHELELLTSAVMSSRAPKERGNG